MGLENFHLTVMPDPMVAEANIYDLSQKKVLSDSVLAKYLRRLYRFSLDGSLLRNHAIWLTQVFSELLDAPDIPQPWAWSDLVRDTSNVGSVSVASEMCATWSKSGVDVAYWTGGLELTQNHYTVAVWLLERGYNVILGVEPYTYSDEGGKDRGAITDDIVSISLWSAMLKDRGFIFSVPRPRPNGGKELGDFYTEIYREVTSERADIVVSELDPHKEDKMRRGKTILVPAYGYPSTTQLASCY